MAFPASFALLITAVSGRALEASIGIAALVATIPLTPVTACTDGEDRTARWIDAGAQAEDEFFGAYPGAKQRASIPRQKAN